MIGFALEQRAVADSARDKAASGFWFAPYVDATLTPFFQFQDRGANPTGSVVLGFVVADPTDGCTPSWGGVYSLASASATIDLDRRIARLRQQGGHVTVSFGGQANTELAVACTSVPRLAAAYRSVISRYRLTSIDFDIEGDALNAPDSFARRAQALAQVQAAQRKAGKKLAVWLTLPVAPSGIPAPGVQALQAVLSAGVAVNGVNVMTMDFGGSRAPSQSMISAVEQSLAATSRQVAAAYRARGQSLGAKVWIKIGATPMIGQNDVAADRFDLGAARQLAAFARAKGISRISMWSLNRDQPCGPNVVDQQTVQNACSGIAQQPLAFTHIFRSPGAKAVSTTASHSLNHVIVDNPATSPYPIWHPTYGYSRGYKVVRHGFVFQAKWWSQDVAPDAPVAHAWQTPWQVIGPVLPGEHPPALKRLPPGTYPEWSGSVTYRKGQRVLADGLPYEAKWFTRGEPPQVQAANIWDSPWLPLFTVPGEPPAPSGAPPPQSVTAAGPGG